MTTKAQVLAAHRRCHGQLAFVREHKTALKPAQREERREHVRAIHSRLAEIDREVKAARGHWRKLLANSQRVTDLEDEATALRSEREQIGAYYRRRWEACHVSSGVGLQFVTIDYETIDYEADTLDELLAKVEGRTHQPATAATREVLAQAKGGAL